MLSSSWKSLLRYKYLFVCVQVNVPKLTHAFLPEAAPWLKLCTRLARLVTATLVEEPSVINVTVAGWLRGKSDIVGRAVKMGCVKSERVNMINVQNQAKTKVTVVELQEEGSGIVTVECDGVKLSGTVLGESPVLTCVGSECVGLVKLSGCVIVAKGISLADVVQQVSSISEVKD